MVAVLALGLGGDDDRRSGGEAFEQRAGALVLRVEAAVGKLQAVAGDAEALAHHRRHAPPLAGAQPRQQAAVRQPHQRLRQTGVGEQQAGGEQLVVGVRQHVEQPRARKPGGSPEDLHDAAHSSAGAGACAVTMQTRRGGGSRRLWIRCAHGDAALPRAPRRHRSSPPRTASRARWASTSPTKGAGRRSGSAERLRAREHRRRLLQPAGAHACETARASLARPHRLRAAARATACARSATAAGRASPAREVEARFPGEYAAWEEDPFTFAPRGRRVRASPCSPARCPCPRDRRRATPAQRVLVVSHKATLRLLLSSLLGFDARGYRDRLDQAPACLNVARLQGPGARAADAVQRHLALRATAARGAARNLSKWWDVPGTGGP